MGEIDFTFKFSGGEPVKRGRIHENIPPEVIHEALEENPVFAYVKEYKK